MNILKKLCFKQLFGISLCLLFNLLEARDSNPFSILAELEELEEIQKISPDEFIPQMLDELYQDFEQARIAYQIDLEMEEPAALAAAQERIKKDTINDLRPARFYSEIAALLSLWNPECNYTSIYYKVDKNIDTPRWSNDFTTLILPNAYVTSIKNKSPKFLFHLALCSVEHQFAGDIQALQTAHKYLHTETEEYRASFACYATIMAALRSKNYNDALAYIEQALAFSIRNELEKDKLVPIRAIYATDLTYGAYIGKTYRLLTTLLKMEVLKGSK